MRRLRPTAVPAIVATIVAVAVAVASAGAAGGLSIDPAIFETTAKAGQVGTVTVANTTSKPMQVTVRTRPWRQARSAAVAADGRRTLTALVRVQPGAFTLAPGGRRTLAITLPRVPEDGSLYGALDVVGTPQGMSSKSSIRTRYRLVGALRLDPSAARRVLRVSVGALRVVASRPRITLRNAGNTVIPVTGTVRITGGAGTVRATFPQTRILPGRTVDVSLRSGRLITGRYVAVVTLRQGSRQVTKLRRGFRVR